MESAYVSTSVVDRILLICGLVAVALFPVTDVLGGVLWKGYNPVSQSISELVADGSPTRGVLLPLEILRHLLMLAFAAGVWRVTGVGWASRVVAVLLVVNAITSALGAAVWPMRVAPSGASTVPPANLAVMATGMVSFVLAILFGILAYPGAVRVFGIATLAAYVILTLIGLYVAPRIALLHERVTIGAQERTMVALYLVWLVLLAATLLRRQG